ncbi:hypothetical protein GE21DRAFT_1326110 [Neurospora crassa]|nr:hypothetical protein GE21DRAFT_1326110 [Neurospora crassa]
MTLTHSYSLAQHPSPRPPCSEVNILDPAVIRAHCIIVGSLIKQYRAPCARIEDSLQVRGEVAQAVTPLGTVQVTASDLEDPIVYNTKPRPVNDTVLVVYVPRSMWKRGTSLL